MSVLRFSTWQPVAYIAADLNIPEQTIRSWMRRDNMETRLFEGRILIERRAIDIRCHRYKQRADSA